MHLIDGFFRVRQNVLALVLCLTVGIAAADDPVRAGRYLERNVEVHEVAQIDPLRQVVDLDFDPYIPIGYALDAALAGTGYRLAAADQDPAQQLLGSRIALVHTRFERKRINSIVDAIVGTGRGFDVSVDHVGRRVMVRAQGQEHAEPEPVSRPPSRGWLSRLFGQSGRTGRAARDARDPGR